MIGIILALSLLSGVAEDLNCSNLNESSLDLKQTENLSMENISVFSTLDGGNYVLGVIQKSQFLPLYPEGRYVGSIRLTKIKMMEARSPESEEMDLTPYEGRTIMVSYNGQGGGWLYSSQVIDQAGHMITAVILDKFGWTNQTSKLNESSLNGSLQR